MSNFFISIGFLITAIQIFTSKKIARAYDSADYSLMGDFISVGKQTPGDTTMLFSDFDAISAKNIFTGEDKKKFDTLFSYIDVTNTKDSKVLAEEIQKSLSKTTRCI